MLSAAFTLPLYRSPVAVSLLIGRPSPTPFFGEEEATSSSSNFSRSMYDVFFLGRCQCCGLLTSTIWAFIVSLTDNLGRDNQYLALVLDPITSK